MVNGKDTVEVNRDGGDLDGNKQSNGYEESMVMSEQDVSVSAEGADSVSVRHLHKCDHTRRRRLCQSGLEKRHPAS